MKVLHVSGNRFPPLPAAHHTLAIWRELAKGVAEYHVFARANGGRGSVTQDGNLTVHLTTSLIAREAEALVTSVALIPLIRQLHPSVILCQCPVFGGLAAAHAARRYRIPLMVELHGEHFFRDRQASSRARLLQALARPALRAATTVRVLSADMQASLRLTFGDPIADKSVVIPTRVDLNIFSPPKDDYRAGGRLRVVTVGSYVPVKNHLQLIEVLRDLPQVHLTIVGAGPLRRKYELAIAAAGLQHRVVLHPWVPQKDLAAVLARHDAYVHYSTTEALARAILEAMGVGLPVVATDVGFIHGVLRDEDNALLLRPPWHHALTSALTRLMQSVALRERLGRAGAEMIRRDYEWTSVFDRYRAALRATEESQPPPVPA